MPGTCPDHDPAVESRGGPGGDVVVRDGQRSPLGTVLKAGETATVAGTVVAPSAPGTYCLEFDVVRERVRWWSLPTINPKTITVGVE